MAYEKILVCLAKSIKHNPNYCIAGKEWQNKKFSNWIRPISSDDNIEGAIPPNLCRFSDGTSLAVLDVVKISFTQHFPHSCQTENHLVHTTTWQKLGKIDLNYLASLVETYPDLWTNGNSSYNGTNDRLSVVDAQRHTDSLRLIRPSNFRLKVQIEGESFGNPKRSMRAHFEYAEVNYVLKVTDPLYTANIRNYILDKEYEIPNAMICTSIGDSYQGNHYKLVASIFAP